MESTIECTTNVASWLEALQSNDSLWQLLQACGQELGILGSLASILPFVVSIGVLLWGGIKLIVRFGVDNSKLDYYLNTHHLSDFNDVALLSPEQKLAKRKAITLHNEIEAYRSRRRIRVYENRLVGWLAKLERLFGEENENQTTTLEGNDRTSSSYFINQKIVIRTKNIFNQDWSIVTGLMSEGSYKFCLVLAFAYPCVFVVINGMITNQVALAQDRKSVV